MILLLGACGLERLIPGLQAAGLPVGHGGWTETHLVDRFDPALIYVDLFPADTIAPLTSAALTGLPLPIPDLTGPAAVIAALRGRPVVYRGLRRPTPLAFGLTDRHPALEAALDRMADLLAGERVLDVGGLLARFGEALDDVDHGLGHGEPGPDGVAIELEALLALYVSRTQPPIKLLAVDLDDTLIHGELADPGFAAANPAYQPRGEDRVGDGALAFWRLRRGLHEALRLLQRRGLLLALVTRNDPRLIADRFHKAPPDPAAPMAATLALGPDDFVRIEASLGPKSAALRRIAAAIGIGLDAIAFLDDSPFERAEVAAHCPGVLVLEGEPRQLRDQLLFGGRFTPWEAPATPRRASLRSTLALREATDPAAFLAGLDLQIHVRSARPDELPRARELFARSNQLRLTRARPAPIDTNGLYVGYAADRLADHGLVAVGLFGEGRLLAYAASCRILPHQIAGALLHLMRRHEPAAAVAFEDTGHNAAAAALLDVEALPPWVRLSGNSSAGPAATW